MISPGHYESYRGVSKNDCCEYDESKKIVQIILDKIGRMEGFRAFLVEGKLFDKVDQINRISPHFALEVHLGNSNDPEISGARTFFMMRNRKSQNFAEILLKNLVKFGQEDQGSSIGWFKKITPEMIAEGKGPIGWTPKVDLFLAKTSCPSAQVEPFFISSSDDVKKFTTSELREEIADNLISSILEFSSQLNLK